jgi:hypothetical protein
MKHCFSCVLFPDNDKLHTLHTSSNFVRVIKQILQDTEHAWRHKKILKHILRDYLYDLGLGERIILKFFLEKYKYEGFGDEFLVL